MSFRNFQQKMKDFLNNIKFDCIEFPKEGKISHDLYKQRFTEKMQEEMGKHNTRIKNRHVGRSVIQQIQDKEKLTTMFNSARSKRPTRRSQFITNISGKNEFLKAKADEI